MEPAWAKLNLSLDVLGARSDGFHDLRMVMQSVDLHDDVTVTLDDTGVCRAETNRSYLPCGADNVAVRAAQVFLSRAGLTCGGVELVGFAKTKLLEPNEKETLTVEVKGEDFKTYDSYNKRTYILEKGDYYLGVGTSSHNAINNILAKKGYSTSNGMDENGNSSLVEKITINNDDFEKYSASSQTGYKITNQFDDVDINLYEGTKDQKITYLSRSNWNETYPTKPVSLKCTDEKMVYDMQYAHVPEANENDTMPLMETITSEFGELNLAMIKDLPFNDPMWEDLLNQLSWNEMNYLCTYGYLFLAGRL